MDDGSLIIKIILGGVWTPRYGLDNYVVFSQIMFVHKSIDGNIKYHFELQITIIIVYWKQWFNRYCDLVQLFFITVIEYFLSEIWYPKKIDFVLYPKPKGNKINFCVKIKTKMF